MSDPGSILIFAAALLYSAVGHGGASGYLAVMALLGTAPVQMRATALVLNVIVASIATVQFARAGHFRWSLFLPFALASVPAAYVGGRISLEHDVYRVLVGSVLMLSAARFALTLRATDSAMRMPTWWVAAPAGAALGLLAGLTGVGGGIFLSPLLLIAGWADLRTTAATSAAFILVNSLAGLGGLGVQGAVGGMHTSIAAWAAAAALGGLVGSTVGSVRASPKALRLMLAAVLLVAGGKLIAG